jgi:hypothetical protein
VDIWNTILYTGKDTKWDDKYKNLGLSMSSVLSLIEPLLNQGYCLITDNFYTSPGLYEILLDNKTDSFGIARSTRNGMPNDIRRLKPQIDEVLIWKKGKLTALKWKDKKDICMLSSIHNGCMIQYDKDGKASVRKPDLIIDYNKKMGGVDKSDQGMASYPVMRSQQRKYYKKIFRLLIEQCLWQCFSTGVP